MTTTTMIIDVKAAMSRVDNDVEFYEELVGIFFEQYEEQREKMCQAIASLNRAELKKLAHTVKGALGNLGALCAQESAFSLERASEKATKEELEQVFAVLNNEISKFQSASVEIASKENT